MRVYADNAATTYLSKTARDVMIECLDKFNGNPNSLHTDGQLAQEKLDEARSIVAECINAKNANEIYFTSGGSESDNWALKATAFTKREKGKHIIVNRKNLEEKVHQSLFKDFTEQDIEDYYRLSAKMMNGFGYLEECFRELSERGEM